MRVTWLGQAGFLVNTDNLAIMIDPYLSNSIGEKNPDKNRKIPVDKYYLGLKPDVVCITHNHADHLDKQTLDVLLSDNKGVITLTPLSCWSEMRKYVGSNAVLFDEETEWSERGVVFKAVKAVHSDEKAIGIIIKSENKTLYFTGDTLYSGKVIRALCDEKIDAVFLPINGKGNNMNAVDAARFIKKINVKKAYPMHYGMFDGIDPKTFTAENAVIMDIYKSFEV